MSRLFLVWLLSFSLSAQAQQYSLRNYKAIDGLPQSQVNIVVEDSHGYLWIGTHGGGLARFDGREFKVYTTLDGLLSNIVTFLKIDSKQNIWIVHPRGITKFDGSSFKKFQQPGKPSSIKRIRRIFQHGDSLFFISVPGVLGKIHDDSVYYWSKQIVEGKSVSYSHLLPSRETMLYLNDSSFLLLANDGSRKEFHHKHYFNRLYNNIFNYKGNAWLSTDSGYFWLNTTTRNFIKSDLPIKNRILSYDSVQDVFWTRSDRYLLKEKVLPLSHVIDTVLADEEISQILPDSEGSTWLATSGNGLFKYFIQDFNRCSSKNIKGVMSILKEEDGTSWIGTVGKGIRKMKKGKISAYVEEEEPYRNVVVSLERSPDGTVWAGTNYGLGKYNKDKDSFEWFTSNEGLSSSTISCIEFGENGTLWIGTFSGGVNFYDGSSFTNYSVKDGLLSANVLSECYVPTLSSLFIGSEFGLSKLSEGAITHEPIPEIENTSVLSINMFRDSLLLVGTGGAGIVIYNPASGKKQLITSKEGLVSDFIYFVAADKQGDIWIGSEKGISRLRLTNNLEIERNLHYDHDNGLEGVEANQNAFYLGEKEKYFGMIDGLYDFNNAGRSVNKNFALHLTEVNVLYGQQSLRGYAQSFDGFFKIPRGLSLPPELNHITFKFNRVDKQYPKSVKFKYRLLNYDKAWSVPSYQNEVTYSNLPSGNYTLEVLATDNQGSWSSQPVTYSFAIETPFYKTAGFIVLMVAILIAMIVLIFLLRVRHKVNRAVMLENIRAHEQEVLRKDIARDFHDEMGNQLSRIINYVSLLRLNGKSGIKQEDLMNKVEGSAKYLYSGTRDFIWSIDPVNDELSKLFIHLRDFGVKLFEEKSIQFRAFNEVREKVILPYGFSRQANLIFKEAMTNAFKYSEAENCTLILKREGRIFQLCFKDDGVGFTMDSVKDSNGLQNIKDRAARINGKLIIQSSVEENTIGSESAGTRVILEFSNIKSINYGATV
jgi:ligand-binding sensor domain-containing protein/signal transduction histidine kinase